MRRPTLLVLEATVWGPMRRSVGRTLLAILAIALGVALGFAVYLINRAAADEVSRAARGLFGIADFAIEAGPGGIDEMLYPQVSRVPGVDVASPVVEVAAKLAGQRGALQVIGTDAFRARLLQPQVGSLAGTMSAGAAGALDPDALFLSANAAHELHLAAGDSLELQVGLQVIAFKVKAVLPAQALRQRAALIDIATAQWKFDRLGKLTRINLRLQPGANPKQVRNRLQRLLPADARIVTPSEASSDAMRLSSAYRSNLTALALVALFTGGFLVYSTQTLSVLRRRREFALLHAIGVTHRQQILFALASGAVIGIAGAMLGIILGLAAAHYAIAALGGNLGAGYFRGDALQIQVTALELLAFAALGAGTAIAGTLSPAFDTARIPTAAALKAGDVASGRTVPRTGLAALLIVVAASLLLLPPIDSLPLPGYVSIALLILASVIAIATLMRAVLSRMPRGRMVTWQIAIAHLIGTARYVTLSVAAIVVSFSLMVAMLIMVTSFRSSLDAWTQKILPADLYLRAGYVGQSSFLDEATLRRLQALPQVARFETGRFEQLSLIADRAPVTLVVRSLEANAVEDDLWIERKADTPAPPDAIPVWVSEVAADLYDLQPGASISLPLGGKGVAASVRGIWRDYEHQNGAVLMNRASYIRLTGDTAVNTLSLWVRDGASVPDLARAIRDALPAGADYDLRVPKELRQLSLAVFDRTFAVTYLLELVAIVIGLLGISTSTSAQVLARRGEFGVMRYLGFTRKQIAAMLGIEGLLLGSVGVAVGLLTGSLVSMILIYVVNRQSFHWSMDVFVPYPALAVLSVLVVGSSAAIAIVSGRNAMSGDVVAAVKEDW